MAVGDAGRWVLDGAVHRGIVGAHVHLVRALSVQVILM